MTTLFNKISDLKDKFYKFVGHTKKVRALENLSSVSHFNHKGYLALIKNCMNDGFLGEKESEFLGYMVSKYFSDKNFLDWSHKTPWLKEEMKKLTKKQENNTATALNLFDEDKRFSLPSVNSRKIQYARNT
jgi:hypothetical protein